MIRGLAALALGLVALFGEAGAVARPEVTAQASIADAFEAYGRGERVRLQLGTKIDEFLRAIRGTGPRWIREGPASDQVRRRNVVALLALEAAFSTPHADRMVLLEWACDLLRTGERSEFDREWLLASIAYAQAERLGHFLLTEECPATSQYAACHQMHAVFRYPEDRRFEAGKIFARNEVNVVSRRPVLSPSVLIRANPIIKVHPPAVPSAADADRMADTLTRLEALTGDPAVGSMARMRIGILHYELQRFEDSRRTLASVIDHTQDRYLRYFVHLVRGLGYNAEGRPENAQAEFERAVAIDPGVISGALELSTLLVASGRATDASVVMDRATSIPATIDDPWQYPCPDCADWSKRLQRLRAAVRK